MKPYLHAKLSVKRYGGKPEDYQAIHDFFDSSKVAYANVAHRAILHNSFGIFLAEKLFGVTLTNSDGKVVSVRDIAEEHVFQDLGFIPTVESWLKNLPIEDWMLGRAVAVKRTRTLDLNTLNID